MARIEQRVALFEPRRGLQERRVCKPERRNRFVTRERDPAFRLEVGQILDETGSDAAASYA
jgi:hypothetical protein